MRMIRERDEDERGEWMRMRGIMNEDERENE